MKAKSYLLLAASVFSLLSCAKEEQTQEITPEMSAPICIIAEAAESAPNKTHIEDYPGTGPGSSWNLSETGKKFDVFWDDEGEQVSLSIYTLDKTHKSTLKSQGYTPSYDKKQATFSFNRPDLPSGDYLFYSVSPFASVKESNIIFLPSEQNVRKRSITPKYSETAVNTCYYDPKSALLVSRCQQATLPSEDPFQLHMKYERASALNCITMKNMPRGVLKVEIEFTQGSGKQYIAGGRYFYPFTSAPGAFVTSTDNSTTKPLAETKITLNCKDESGNAAYFEEQPDIWFNSWGIVLQKDDIINVTAYAVHATYTANLTIGTGKSLYLVEGCMNHFTVDFSENRTGIITKEMVAPGIVPSTGNGRIYFGSTAQGAPEEYTAVSASNGNNPFWPGFDKVRIRAQEAQTSGENYKIEVLPELFYEVTQSEIHLKGLPAQRVGQHLQLYLYRGTKEVVENGLITSYDPTEYYPLFSEYTKPTPSGFDNTHWIQMVDPETENPKRFRIVDPALQEQLKKSISANSNSGFAAIFDEYGAVTGCGNTNGQEFAVTSGTFHSFRNLAAFNGYKTQLGSLSDERNGNNLKYNSAFRIWNNLNLDANSEGKIVVDFRDWNAPVNVYNYHQVEGEKTTITKSLIHELYLGPNMTGYRWLMTSTDEDDFVETIDCSKSSEVHYIIHYGWSTKLKILDLRVKGKQGKSGGDNSSIGKGNHWYTRLCNKSYVALGCLNSGKNMNGLFIKINRDLYDRARPYQWASGNDKDSRVFAYYIAVYLKKAAQSGAKIEVWENDWNGGGQIMNLGEGSHIENGYWDIVNDGNINNSWPTLPSGNEYNTWPLYAEPKNTYEDGNYWN